MTITTWSQVDVWAPESFYPVNMFVRTDEGNGTIFRSVFAHWSGSVPPTRAASQPSDSDSVWAVWATGFLAEQPEALEVRAAPEEWREVTLHVTVTVEVFDDDYSSGGKVEFGELVDWEPGRSVAEQIAGTVDALRLQVGPTLDNRAAHLAGIRVGGKQS